MQKSETTYFDPQTGKMVHRDLTPNGKGKKMAMTDENGSETSKPKRDVGGNIKVFFLDEEGKEYNAPPEKCVGVRAHLVKLKEDEVLDLETLSPDMLRRLAAFGASVLGRNEVNTTPEDDGPETAGENLRARWEGFRQDSYRRMSVGGATPLILLALMRALKEFRHPETGQGLADAAIEEKVARWRAEYDSGEDEDAQKKSRARVTKELRKSPEVRAAVKAIQDERAASREERAPQVSLGDL